MPHVESSVISFVHYDEAAAELHVLFTTGKAYVYFGVPSRVYDALLEAPSIGSFFNAQIRNAYRYRRSISPLGKHCALSRPRRLR